ncbi:hypothetical protein DQ400_19530 [Vreelandella sulfidaeris]|uniref:DUF4145 domain-containing protein n=1 Tax=Vreelandella sulfidaeris TaxID=115553 RepID=A0A365THZ1_9GAMM|nr:hypothetical protein [Halomonas sulfidaeris]RBI65081.1 hypothetical protein DQ400_19530 [Halomonas sulfidaeris]
MTKKEAIRKELDALYAEGAKLAVEFQKEEDNQFQYDYQRWYTKAIKAVASLASDRLTEFRGYYEVDPKRKSLGYGTYVVQDYFKGVAPNKFHYPDFDTRAQVLQCFFNQLTILNAVGERVDSVLANIEEELYAELQDSELAIARQLAKISVRAAGALVGVVIEGHLQKVARAHAVKVAKKNPTIADLNDPLKAASVIDTPAWRKISFLADLRNLCSHKKDAEPTKEQVEELIQGAGWLTKNVF